jgi:hypothetical protein
MPDLADLQGFFEKKKNSNLEQWSFLLGELKD